MLGFAQKLFLDKGGKLPAWPAPARKTWPQIEKFLAKHLIDYFDFALTQFLLRHASEPHEDLAAFICYLSMAVRAGHLCIRIDQCSLTPDPAALVVQMSEESRRNEVNSLKIDAQAFALSAFKGSSLIPASLCSEQFHEIKSDSSTPLCRSGNRVYFQRYWQAESQLLQHLERIRSTPPRLLLKKNVASESVKELLQQQLLLPEQASAIIQACESSFFILSGGPGTGKTYTAGHLIRTFWKALSTEQQSSFKIVLAAPTGKAATNLQASLANATAGVSGFPPIRAQTLHSLLGIRSDRNRQQTTQVSADLILVDECSMVDLQMMATLFAAIKPGVVLFYSVTSISYLLLA